MTSLVLTGFYFLVGFHVPRWWPSFLYLMVVIFSLSANILHTTAFYFYFGRRILPLCHNWTLLGIRNHFLFTFFVGSLFSVMELCIIVSWRFDDEPEQIRNKFSV